VSGKTAKWNYSYDKAGRLLEAHLDSRLICQCHYDKEGRRTQDCFPKTSGSHYREYRYTFENRLQAAGDNTYTHDDNGQHETKFFNGQMVEAYKWLDFTRLAGFHDGQNSFEFAYEMKPEPPYAVMIESPPISSTIK
jgi:YD repeat-containing protein